MKKEVYICDLCKQERNKEDIYSIKVKSAKFITYMNYDEIGANKAWIDICKCCVKDFERFIKNYDR